MKTKKSKSKSARLTPTCNICDFHIPWYRLPKEIRNSKGEALGKCKITGKMRHPSYSCKRYK